jgi:hypothetical protein
LSKAIPGQATVLAATQTGHSRWYQSAANRYDFALDVRADDGSVAFRTQLLNVRIYQNAPKPGTEMRVEIGPGDNTVTILWKGDPNLDLDAWRAQRAEHDQQTQRAALEDGIPEG